MAAPIHVGLTGGIGSGKSTVAALLAKFGAGVIDADAISRSTTASGGAAIPAIRTVFGDGFIGADGALDRDRMRQHVFAQPDAKRALEAIIHPLVGQAIATEAQQLTQAGTRCLVFDIPLLVESGHWRKKLDRVLVVDCSAETQVQRVCARNGMQAEDVRKIVAAQASRMQRLAAADLVLCNDGISLEELAAQVAEISRQFGL
jgi:dephospho-CoA kinase